MDPHGYTEGECRKWECNGTPFVNRDTGLCYAHQERKLRKKAQRIEEERVRELTSYIFCLLNSP
jgi:hypothetical protein